MANSDKSKKRRHNSSDSRPRFSKRQAKTERVVKANAKREGGSTSSQVDKTQPSKGGDKTQPWPRAPRNMVVVVMNHGVM